jgi:S-adenosylmethionine uptake transporter
MKGLSAAWTMVLATLLFAGMGLGVKKASAHVSTAEIVFYRGLVGALIIGALAWYRQLPLRTDVPFKHLWRGMAGVTALSLWFYAIGQLPLSTAVTLNYMSSVWMAVFLVLRLLWRRWQGAPVKRLDPVVLWAVLFGFVGVTLVLQPTLTRDQWLAGLIGLVSGMLSAWAYLAVVALGRTGEPEHRVVFYFSFCSAAVGLVLLLVDGTWGAVHAGQPWSQWLLPTERGWDTWGWLLAIGVFATAAQLAMTRAFAQGQALSMASLQYLGIVHAFVLGIWFFDEPLHGVAVAGALLIVGAGMAANRASRSLND